MTVTAAVTRYRPERYRIPERYRYSQTVKLEMTDGKFKLYIIVTALGALGTFLAVIAALFGNILRAKFKPPKVRIDLLNASGEKTTLTETQTGAYEDDARFYHLRVRNENRHWSPATGTEMRLVRIEEPGPDGQLQTTWLGEDWDGGWHDGDAEMQQLFKIRVL